MRRRVLLTSSAGLLLPSLIPGCQRQPTDLTLALVKGSLPTQAIETFRHQQARGTRVGVNSQNSLEDIHRLLTGWQAKGATLAKAGTISSWAAQTDSWLAPNQLQHLIQPIDTSGLNHWSQLHSLWRQLVQPGPPTPAGQVWGVPYRWTGLALVYDRKQLPADLGWQTWNDLLHPALHRQIMLPDQPRLLLGLALKALGASANQKDLTRVNGLEDFLTQLRQQVRWYDSQYTLKALIKGDARAVVTWLDGIVPVLSQYPHLRVRVPAQGTLISADLWVRPKQSQPASALQMAWLDFCLSPAFAEALAIYSRGLSPHLWGTSPDQLPNPLKTQAELFSALGNSEFLYPLEDAVEKNYQTFWQRLEQTYRNTPS
ncbi:MAG: extracellular solute-binding protein [Cyanobacteria bacterium REEB459]|nr:extracellular solute-binding protein [Cyanobacteria bacterium REEB459]